MPPPSDQLSFLAAHRQFFHVIGIVLILFALANLPWTLDDYDQAKQAFVSYQMLEQHRWLFQTTPTEGLPSAGKRHSQFHISSKPPAIGWLSTGLYEITRSHPRFSDLWHGKKSIRGFGRADCARCFWIQLIQSTLGDACSHRYAVGFGLLRYRGTHVR